MIGLDGATWDLINPWINENLLPNIKRLKKEGVASTLFSTIPPVTGPAWTSLATGANPGKHGIYGFQSLKNGRITLNTPHDIKCLTLQEILSEKNLTNLIIGLPLSFPPSKGYKGIMISDFFYPVKTIYPNSKKNYLEEYEVSPSLFKNGEELLDDMLITAEKQIKTAKKLFINEKWDFFFFLYSETDQVCHTFWNEIKKDISLGDKAKSLFKIADQFIGWISENIEKDDLLLICSDHGFGNNKHSIRINSLLRKKGLIKTRLNANYRINSVWANIQRMRDDSYIESESIFSKIFQTLLKCPFLKFLFYLEGKYRDFFLVKLINFLFRKLTGTPFYKEMIDYSNSIAFTPSSEWMGVCVNQDDGLIDKLITYFKKIKYKNQPIFKKVIKNTDIYTGNFLNEGPDILLLSSDFVVDAALLEKIIIKNYPISTHKLNGFFIAYGNNIKEGQEEDYFHLYDIAPTILHYLDIPIPLNMDGRVLMEIFKEDSIIRKRTIRKVEETDKLNDKIRNLTKLNKL